MSNLNRRTFLRACAGGVLAAVVPGKFPESDPREILNKLWSVKVATQAPGTLTLSWYRMYVGKDGRIVTEAIPPERLYKMGAEE